MGFVEVAVKIPEERLGAFYAMLGEWLAGSTEPDGPSRRPEWGPADVELARVVLAALPKNPRTLLDLLVAEGEMTSEDVVSRLGLDSLGQVTGIAGWIGRTCATVGRATPVKTRTEDGRLVWGIPDETAEVFKRANG